MYLKWISLGLFYLVFTQLLEPLVYVFCELWELLSHYFFEYVFIPTLLFFSFWQYGVLDLLYNPTGLLSSSNFIFKLAKIE